MNNDIEIKLKQLVDVEIANLKEDITKFRDLESEYTTKLVEEKIRLSKQLNEELSALAKRLERFCVGRLTMELSRSQYDRDLKSKHDTDKTKLMEAIVDNIINDRTKEAEIIFHIWMQAYLQEDKK